MSHCLSKIITDRMKQLGQVDIPTRVVDHVTGIGDMCRDHRDLTTCQKQYRQNEPAGQVDVPTRLEVPVMGDPGDVVGTIRCLTACQKKSQTE